MGDTLPVYVQENPHFRLPADDVPIIMIGAGTGVAPYRAFLQEREARGAAGRSWLFFGERNFRSDFLYQARMAAVAEGRSPDPSRRRLLARHGGEGLRPAPHARAGRDLYAWLEEGAHLYVCGDEKAMAPDVHAALIEIVEREGGPAREAAEDYLARLAAEHRYQRDVY